jgi:sulfane dehydrogenase subunit SoxC
MDAKSTITQPTFPTKLSGPGWWPITGLAWSGRGRIAHVDVSTDAGVTWTRAELCNDPAPKAMVRFRHLWQWDGAESVLMSRATDETGYVQPSWQEFVAAWGAGARHHVNPIRAWRVGSDGAVTYVPPEDA